MTWWARLFLLIVVLAFARINRWNQEHPREVGTHEPPRGADENES